jgi:hypothetical protein
MSPKSSPAAPSPNFHVPPSAFTPPAQLAITAQTNPAWVTGYEAGRSLGDSAALPSPQPTDTWATYWASFSSLSILKDPIQGDSDVGFNNAIENAANWIWLNDPLSPHNMVY